MTTSPETKQINNDISARRVFVIDENGSKIGEFLKHDALKLATERGLDLVQVSEAIVPFCRLMDHNKLIYNYRKQLKADNAASSKIKQKEIRLSPKIAEADLQVRVIQARNFLGKGHSVKVAMKFKGPDMRHPDIGLVRCNDFIKLIHDIGTVESPPKMNGKWMIFTLSPK